MMTTDNGARRPPLTVDFRSEERIKAVIGFNRNQCQINEVKQFLSNKVEILSQFHHIWL